MADLCELVKNGTFDADNVATKFCRSVPGIIPILGRSIAGECRFNIGKRRVRADDAVEDFALGHFRTAPIAPRHRFLTTCWYRRTRSITFTSSILVRARAICLAQRYSQYAPFVLSNVGTIRTGSRGYRRRPIPCVLRLRIGVHVTNRPEANWGLRAGKQSRRCTCGKEIVRRRRR